MGLVALALLHVSAATHQFEHSAEHDLSVCEACGAHNQLDDPAVSGTPGEVTHIASDDAVAPPRTETYQGVFTATYWSRAPPRS